MGENIVEIKNLSKEFRKQEVLRGITMHIPENCVYGLLGPNGAGKSTLLKMAFAANIRRNFLSGAQVVERGSESNWSFD